MSRSWLYHVRPCPSLKPSRSAWAGRFRGVSSFGSDFNYDFHVSFTKEELDSGSIFYNYGQMTPYPVDELQGISVFYKNDAGEVFHTYSSYARGCDMLVSTYNLLDLTPKGRDEDGLAFTMSWVRHHDRYENKPVDTHSRLCSTPRFMLWWVIL